MAKWYTYLTSAKEERIPIERFVPPKKGGRIQRTFDIFFLEINAVMKGGVIIALAFLPFLFFCLMANSGGASLKESFEYAMNTGIGYPVLTVENLSKTLAFLSDLKGMLPLAFLSLLLPGPLYAGAFNVARRLNTGHEEIKAFRLFFEGVKKHWWKYSLVHAVLVAAIFFGTHYLLFHYRAMLTDKANAGRWIGLIAIVIAILTLFVTATYIHAMIPAYNMKFRNILKNSAFFTVGLYPSNMIMAVLIALPLLLVLTASQVVIAIGLVVFLLLAAIAYPLFYASFAEYGFENILNKIYETGLLKEQRVDKEADKPAKKALADNSEKKPQTAKQNGKAASAKRPMKPASAKRPMKPKAGLINSARVTAVQSKPGGAGTGQSKSGGTAKVKR